MKQLIIISILAVAACGSKPKSTTTPANKTSDKGSMGGAGYGGGSAMTPANPTSGGDPCAN